MNHRPGASNALLTAALLSAGAVQAATVPQPATKLYGGGATIIAEAYLGSSFLAATPNLRLLNTFPPLPGEKTNLNAVSKGSLFYAYAANTTNSAPGLANTAVGVQWCLASAGTGRRMLIGNFAGISSSSTGANSACGDYSTTPIGFGAPSDQITADFVASDTPISNSEVSTFETNLATVLKGKTQIVQTPMVSLAISLPYNNSDFGKNLLVLTQSDICGIFSGQITDWQNLTNTPKYAKPNSKPIKVVYRSDGSGATFSFTNYLSYVCPALSTTAHFSGYTNLYKDTAKTAFNGIPNGNKAVSGFRTTDTFSGTATSGGSQRAYSGFDAGIPAVPTSGGPGFIPTTGNAGVVSTVAATDGSIGYADIADAVSRAKLTGGASLKYALIAYQADTAKTTVYCDSSSIVDTTIDPKSKCATTKAGSFTKLALPARIYNKLDPLKNFPASVAVTVKGDQVLNGIDSAGRPVVAAAKFAAGEKTGCLGFVDPSTYAAPETGATKNAPKDYARYPIISVSYVMAYGGGYGSKLDPIKALLQSTQNATVLAATKTIGKKTGYSTLQLFYDSSSAGSSLADIVNACVVN